MRKPYQTMAYPDAGQLVFGRCKRPLRTRSGLVIGDGQVIPEINFTLPAMRLTKETVKDAWQIYRKMIDRVLQRTVELHGADVMVEYEALPGFTLHPEWGLEVVKILQDVIAGYEARYGLRCGLRVTPNDIREMNRPPVLRSGAYWDSMLAFCEGCGSLGVDVISIESTGGKEVCDNALMEADIRKVIFALGVLGCSDMEFLWERLIQTAHTHGMAAGGDSSCGFSNTAMILADRGLLPKTFAAVVRAATVPRALIPYEMGASGPSKDCEYAGIHIKAVTGCPISMEGKTAAGAHLSPVGNIAGCAADLWSNESIQQVKLLADMAPVVGMEQLIYDCRLMNAATKQGQAQALRDMMIASDTALDVQAYVLRPDEAVGLCQEILKAEEPFKRTKIAAAHTVRQLQKAIKEGCVACEPRDAVWLNRMEEQIVGIPDDPDVFYEQMLREPCLGRFFPEEYGIFAKCQES